MAAVVDLLGQEPLLFGQEVFVQIAIPGAWATILAAVPAVAPLLEQVLALDRRLERSEREGAAPGSSQQQRQDRPAATRQLEGQQV
jgi:hypothetical protein